MPQLQIGPAFFRQEARNYSNTALCIAREALQNAVDTGATQITIHITAKGEDAEFVVADNGQGMSRDVIENVFFRLGSTTKAGAGADGGFGKARILLAFAQHSYAIRTHQLRVAGSAAEYQIEEGLPEVRGCRFTIQVACAALGFTPQDLHSAFYTYLCLSQLAPQVTLNGQRHTDWARRRQADPNVLLSPRHRYPDPRYLLHTIPVGFCRSL